MPASSVTADKLRELTNDIINTITSEEFMSRMEQMRTAPPEERVEKAQELLSVDGLRAAGLDIPDGMRVSSRYFEQELGLFEFGNVDIVQKMETLDKAFVEKLRKERPQLFDRLVSTNNLANPMCVVSDRVIMGACGGAGAGTVCACGGSC